MIARLGDGCLPFHPRLLAPVTARAMLHRLLNNLRAVHFARGDLERTLAALDRMLLLVPDDAVHLRERGLLHLHRGDLVAALEDLTRYVAVEPEAPDREAVRSLLVLGRKQLAVVH
jgi:regulator of sirC expression with transglutaminase-like and TPR domain